MFKKITLAVFMLILATAAFGCNDNINTDSSSAETTPLSTEMTTATGVIYVPVTDSSGNTVTDNDGNTVTTVEPVIITQIPQTTYVTVTDDNGNAVTDSSGEAITSEQTIWVTTMVTATAARNSTSLTTYTTKASTSAVSQTKASTSSAVSTNAVVTTTTAQSSSTGNPNGGNYAYGALSSVVVDLIDTKEDGEFINLVFNVKENASGKYAVNIYEIMMANIDLEVSEFATSNGCVSVGSPIQTDVPTGGTPIIYVSSVEGFAGEQVVVPVYIKNNSGVSAFDFRVEYDCTGLELIAIEKGSIINSNSWIWTTNLKYTP